MEPVDLSPAIEQIVNGILDMAESIARRFWGLLASFEESSDLKSDELSEPVRNSAPTGRC
jgi:hypothetical protein